MFLKITALSRSNRLAPFVQFECEKPGLQDGGMSGTEAIKSYLRNICFVAVRKTRFVMEMFEGLRRRKGDVKQEKTGGEKNSKDATVYASPAGTVEPGTYWLTRIVFLRSLGFIYCKLLKYYLGFVESILFEEEPQGSDRQR